LRHEQLGVDHHGARTVACLAESVAERIVIGAAIGRRQVVDILDRDDLERSAFGVKGCMSCRNGQTALERSPSSPARSPAREKS
jgi:hypothetical protein